MVWVRWTHDMGMDSSGAGMTHDRERGLKDQQSLEYDGAECAIRGMPAIVSLPIPHILLKNPSHSTLVMVGAEATAGSVVLAALDLSGDDGGSA